MPDVAGVFSMSRRTLVVTISPPHPKAHGYFVQAERVDDPNVYFANAALLNVSQKSYLNPPLYHIWTSKDDFSSHCHRYLVLTDGQALCHMEVFSLFVCLFVACVWLGVGMGVGGCWMCCLVLAWMLNFLCLFDVWSTQVSCSSMKRCVFFCSRSGRSCSPMLVLHG